MVKKWQSPPPETQPVLPNPDITLLWLTETYPPGRGGMAQSCDRIVHGLRQRGVRVDVVHFNKRARRASMEQQQHGSYLTFPVAADPAHTLNTLWNRISVDTGRSRWTHIAAFGGTLPLLAGPVFAAWLGVPLVTMLRGNDFDLGIFHSKRQAMLREAVQQAAAVAVVTQDHARKIAAYYPGVRPVWIPNGIALEGWEPLPSDLARAAEWKTGVVEPSHTVIGLIGHLKAKKGGRFFIDTVLASGLADRFHLLLIGETPPELVEYLEIHEADLHYSLHPFLDRYALLRFYPACDYVAIPSFYDGLPNVLLEAAALGIPLMASTAGGMADVLRDGTHGFLFAPGDRAGCHRALHRAAAATDEHQRKLGQACRKLIHEHLTEDLEATRYATLFAECHAGKSLPARNGIALQPNREIDPSGHLYEAALDTPSTFT